MVRSFPVEETSTSDPVLRRDHRSACLDPTRLAHLESRAYHPWLTGAEARTEKGA